MTALPPIPDAPSRDNCLQAIESVPWDFLAHAYSSAHDAPEQLRCFLDAGTDADLAAAIDWLWGSILHQGSIYSASPPVLWVLTNILAARPDHPAAEDILGGLGTLANGYCWLAAEDWSSSPVPVRQSPPGAPAWEVWIATPLPGAGGEVAGGSKQYFQACTVRPNCILLTLRHAFGIAERFMDHPDGNIRRAAAAAWWSIVMALPNAPGAKKRLRALIGNANYEPGVWLSAAIGLDRLGVDVSPLLHDSDPRIRLGAAMTSGTAGVKESVAVLAGALSDLPWLERTFPKGLAHKSMHLRFHVLAALLNATTVADCGTAVVDAICTVVTQRASVLTSDHELGPILRWTFPERIAKLWIKDAEMLPLPEYLTGAQRAVLNALTQKHELWDHKSGFTLLAFRSVQLPRDRNVVARLATLD